MSEKFQYDATFSDNILMVAQTGCGKTSFVQSFNYTFVEFHYPENNEDFSLILETF